MVLEKFNPHGLTSQEAALRLKKFGPNELRQQKVFSSLKILLNQLKSPLIYILILAGLVTLFLRDYTDTLVIFAAVVLNTIFSFYQEQKSEKSMLALRSLITPVAKVIRDGQQKIVNVKDLVPGDLVVLTIGTRVPADGVLVESTDLSIDEKILTGESIPVRKKANLKFTAVESAFDKQEQTVFMGTTVITGIGKMIVTKTGNQTRLGKIGEIVLSTTKEKTPLQKQINKLARNLAITIVLITFFIFLFGLFIGYNPFQIFITSIAIAVAAIPEGLVVTLTVILSLGMQRILKRKALVRQLLATETLGSVSVICADKTGTLTEGKMRVIKALPPSELLIKAAILCNDMRDPLEIGMMEWGKNQLKMKNLKFKIEDYLKLDEIPFNPTDKYIVTLHKNKKAEEQENKKILFLSGAPEIVISKCQMSNAKCQMWQKKFEGYGRKGYRLVGFAYKFIKHKSSTINQSDINNFKWLGILVYEDPIRKGVKKAFEECQSAGVKIKVITGDYLPTALAVLKKLGIKDHQKSLEGKDLEKMTDKELKELIDKVVLFARTTPEQKLRIVQALKEKGEVVAMMGDGVNDAPALRVADIGIVVKDASDLARETSDMVLLDSNFSTIVHAVEEGRSIFENIRKATFYLLSHSFMEIILVGGSLLFRLPLPLTAAQILWINLFQDSLPAITLAFEPKEKHLMDEPPRRKETPVINAQMKILFIMVGVLSPIFLTILFTASLKEFLPFHFSQTLIFTTLGIISLFFVLACRSLKQVFRYNLLQNLPLLSALVFSLVLLLLAIYWPPLQFLLKTQPLGLKQWLWVVSFGLLNLLAIELVKLFLILRKK